MEWCTAWIVLHTPSCSCWGRCYESISPRAILSWPSSISSVLAQCHDRGSRVCFVSTRLFWQGRGKVRWGASAPRPPPICFGLRPRWCHLQQLIEGRGWADKAGLFGPNYAWHGASPWALIYGFPCQRRLAPLGNPTALTVEAGTSLVIPGLAHTWQNTHTIQPGWILITTDVAACAHGWEVCWNQTDSSREVC